MILKKRNRQRELVDAWNSEHEVGTEVEVALDNGTKINTKTVSHATLLGGHTAVIWVKGISGCYALERVKASKKELATDEHR